MQVKWNQFVYLLCDAKQRNVDEDEYHSLIEQQLQLLGWSLYNNEICHKPSLHIGNSGSIVPDILVKRGDDSEFVIEVKRPSHKQVKKDIEQLESYMRQLKLSVGIYIGEHIEVFYDMEESKNAVSVLKIPLEINAEDGVLFIDQFLKDFFEKKRLIQFCKEQVKFIKHEKRKSEIVTDFIEQSNEFAPEAFAQYLTRKHGSEFNFDELKGMFAKYDIRIVPKSSNTPMAHPRIATESQKPSTSIDYSSSSSKVWLICYDKSQFDVDGCFKKLGQIYWHYVPSLIGLKRGDVAYLYSAHPDSAIRYKVEIIADHLSYDKKMDIEDEFSKSTTNSDDAGKLFFLSKLIAETKSKDLSYKQLKRLNLVGKRVTHTQISQEKYKALLRHIEEHFNDVVPRRAPFKFSMIGLKEGDKVMFAPSEIEVRVASDNTIEYDGEFYTLSRFCKHFMPDENSDQKEYQGPAFFTYKGKSLDVIRKEKENKKK